MDQKWRMAVRRNVAPAIVLGFFVTSFFLFSFRVSAGEDTQEVVGLEQLEQLGQSTQGSQPEELELLKNTASEQEDPSSLILNKKDNPDVSEKPEIKESGDTKNDDDSIDFGNVKNTNDVHDSGDSNTFKKSDTESESDEPDDIKDIHDPTGSDTTEDIHDLDDLNNTNKKNQPDTAEEKDESEEESKDNQEDDEGDTEEEIDEEESESVRIEEVFFNAVGSDSHKEWIEVRALTGVDIRKWKFVEGGSRHSLTLKQGAETLLEGERAVIADDTNEFIKIHPEFSGILFDSSFSLGNSGEDLYFLDNESDKPRARFDYSDFAKENHEGFSIELRDDDLWYQSCGAGGTPGLKNCQKDPEIFTHVRVSEIFPDPKQSPEGDFEFIEIENYGSNNIDLTGWSIADKKGNKTLSGTVEVGGFMSFAKTVSLNNDGDQITLFSPKNEMIDFVSYLKEEVRTNWTKSRKGSGEWEWTPHQTPGGENKFLEPILDGVSVRITELFPNPKNEDDEYIELYNTSKESVDLHWWTLRDASGSSYTFDKSVLVESGGYFVVYRDDFAFALNNSTESVTLIDSLGIVHAQAEYTKTKEGQSLSFDCRKWRVSPHLTPGKANRFNELPRIKDFDVSKKVYANVYADFSVKAKDSETKDLKYTWDFGDGKKSYKQSTRHKYEEKGEYTITLTVSDESEDVQKVLKRTVRSYSRPKFRIRAISANPEGKDSEHEWILLKNYDDEDWNLKGWSIATGKDIDSLSNHPVYEDWKIDENEEKRVTRENSKISLNNQAGVVELRYPDGKVAHRVIYDRGQKITEDEVYIKEDGVDWRWEGVPEEVEDTDGEEIVEGEDVYEPISVEFLGKKVSDMTLLPGVDVLSKWEITNGKEVLGQVARVVQTTQTTQTSQMFERRFVFHVPEVQINNNEHLLQKSAGVSGVWGMVNSMFGKVLRLL